MPEPTGLLRRLLARLGRALSPDTHAQLRDAIRRLDRIEHELEQLPKIWQRTRHLEPAIQAVLRHVALDPASLPYPERLVARRFRLLSQNQEDGITAALLAEAGVVHRTFVEIGSGLSGGNTGFLTREWGWRGLMIDGNARMAQVARRFPLVAAVSAWVTKENINDLIAQHGYVGEVDVLSLDIDGNDYWVWDAVTACSPRIVILEYNSSFGRDRAVTVPYDPKFDRRAHHPMYYGASLAALAALSARKGYRLVAIEPTGVNAFFLRADVAPHVPACDAHAAFRMLEKNDILIEGGTDIFRYVQEHNLVLVDVAEAGQAAAPK
jgi:hypothetical protein